MTKRTIRLIKWVLLIFSLVAALTFFFTFTTSLVLSTSQDNHKENKTSADTCLYHVIVTGSHENQSFLSEVFKGASKLSKSYNAFVELHVPQSQADTESLQDLLDYASFLNADGIIAYIGPNDTNPTILHRSDEPEIPLITTGQFLANTNQVSFIGINNWEIGKKVADESSSFLPDGGQVFIISSKNSTNSSNLTTSLQQELQGKENIETNVIEEVPPDLLFPPKQTVFICLSEEDTILYAKLLFEQFETGSYYLIGSGGNEVCQLYLQKGWIDELFSQDPERIGEAAMRELFEYRNKGYANSYVTAEIKITRGGK